MEVQAPLPPPLDAHPDNLPNNIIPLFDFPSGDRSILSRCAKQLRRVAHTAVFPKSPRAPVHCISRWVPHVDTSPRTQAHEGRFDREELKRDMCTAPRVHSCVGVENQMLAWKIQYGIGPSKYVNIGNRNNKTALHHACQLREEVDFARMLVRHGADVRATTSRGHTPLIFACGRGRDELATWLLEVGAETRVKTVTEKNAILLSCRLARRWRNGDTACSMGKGRLDPETLRVLAEQEQDEPGSWRDFQEDEAALAAQKEHADNCASCRKKILMQNPEQHAEAGSEEPPGALPFTRGSLARELLEHKAGPSELAARLARAAAAGMEYATPKQRKGVLTELRESLILYCRAAKDSQDSDPAVLKLRFLSLLQLARQDTLTGASTHTLEPAITSVDGAAVPGESWEDEGSAAEAAAAPHEDMRAMQDERPPGSGNAVTDAPGGGATTIEERKRRTRTRRKAKMVKTSVAAAVLSALKCLRCEIRCPLRELVEAGEPAMVAEILIARDRVVGIDLIEDKEVLAVLIQSLCTHEEYILAARLVEKLHPVHEPSEEGLSKEWVSWLAQYAALTQLDGKSTRRSILHVMYEATTEGRLRKRLDEEIRLAAHSFQLQYRPPPLQPHTDSSSPMKTQEQCDWLQLRPGVQVTWVDDEAGLKAMESDLQKRVSSQQALSGGLQGSAQSSELSRECFSSGMLSVAVDTEWWESDTPSIVQLAVEDHCWVVDAMQPSVAFEEGAACNIFTRLFSLHGIQVVGWGFKHDLAHLQALEPGLEIPHLVDLQPVAQQALNLSQQPSLTSVCSRLLGKALDKAEQCSYWDRRPLLPSQLTYAALDAHVLLQLQPKLFLPTTHNDTA
ncbi:hypothetical protein CYMTET_4495 [Cymbomonas tetramitiformis]|uniref:3'-5' exonuclease domain-containing protein n=1 Tax=Cymbomonas tetramitiformis TaxID=36881 RepID=A0AAE0H1C1_9CHLO|nr:hypothetical protein CYMTET_4495 [Cymbomonas tetramitiformis]